MSDAKTLGSDSYLYQAILMRALKLLAREPDRPRIPNSRFNKYIRLSYNRHKILIRGKRRGDVDISVLVPKTIDALGWRFVFVNTIVEQGALDLDLGERIVLPALQQALVLDELADL